MTIAPDRLDKALIALHDHGTRPDATATKVLRGMQRDGFTSEEIRAAATKMDQ